MSRLGAPLAAVIPLVGIVVAVACGTPDHLYPARRFDRARGCVNPIASLDVVDGTNPGSLCAIVCLVSTRADGGAPDLWVSSECEPFPPFFDTSGADPDCARAIDVYTNGPSCASDGGVLTDAGAADAAREGAAADAAIDADAADSGGPDVDAATD